MALIVSAYYKIPSKQPHSWYLNHMKIYFELLSNHKKIFFCEEDTKNELEKECNTVNTIFIIKPFTELNILKTFPFELWKQHLKYDPEKYHTPELGIVWANKKEFLREAFKLFPDIQWMCWVDAGCIRNYNWKSYINLFLQRCDFKGLSPGVYLQCIRPFIKKQFYTYPDIYIAGALILSHRDYIDEYCTLYDKTLNMYINNNISITMDQYIMASISSCNTSSWLYLVYEPYISKYCPDEWFFFFSKF